MVNRMKEIEKKITQMEIKMKAGDALIHAPKKQAEGELAVRKAQHRSLQNNACRYWRTC